MNLPKRKPTRLSEYDYSAAGTYFITVCTHGHRCTLSKITSAENAPPSNTLTQYGVFVDRVIGTLENRFDATIDAYVIMPNHVHMLISIDCDLRAVRERPLRRSRSTLDKLVGFLKMNSSKSIHSISPNAIIWQRSYYDHIVRNSEDYANIYEYINTNVLRWEKDYLYSDNKTG